MAFLRWITGLIIAVCVTLFAVANRHNITLFLSPFHESFEFPLYLLVLGAMALSFLLGCLMVWFSVVSLTIEKRYHKKEIKELKSRLAERELIE